MASRRKQDWTPRDPVRRYELLEEMAREMVGDGKEPDLFFVGLEGNVVSISLNFATAYDEWIRLSRGNRRETVLEDRWFGTIASVEPEDEAGKKLIRIDDSRGFLRSHGKDLPYKDEDE